MIESDFLIIGAGISGLMSADALRSAGHNVLLLDKGRGVGGRMATRRIANGRADHGAQFFTVRSHRFQQVVDKWLADGLIFKWATGWSGDPALPAKPDGHPRYAGVNGMTAVPKAIADRHTVRKNVRVESITARLDHWLIRDDANTIYKANALIMTPPVPQTLTLLDKGITSLHPDDRAALDKIRYAPCVAGMFLVEGHVSLPEPGALQRPDHAYSWIANNQRKGISPDAQLITVHANAELSWELWDAKPEQKCDKLLAGLRPFLASSATVTQSQAHRWRYAQPIVLHPERTLIAKNLPPLAFAGDAFQEARVEGAVLSGLTAVDALLSSK